MARWRAGLLFLLAVSTAACFEDPPIVSEITAGGPTGNDGGDTDGLSLTTGVSASTAAPTSQPTLDDTSGTGSDSESGDDPSDPTSGTGDSGGETDATESGPTGSSTTDGTDDGSDSDSSSSTGGVAEWTCFAGYYDADDGCDCGCGIVDPDCIDASAASCDYCSQVGSCGEPGGCPSNIDPDNNATCVD